MGILVLYNARLLVYIYSVVQIFHTTFLIQETLLSGQAKNPFLCDLRVVTTYLHIYLFIFFFGFALPNPISRC